MKGVCDEGEGGIATGGRGGEEIDERALASTVARAVDYLGRTQTTERGGVSGGTVFSGRLASRASFGAGQETGAGSGDELFLGGVHTSRALRGARGGGGKVGGFGGDGGVGEAGPAGGDRSDAAV